MRQHSSTVHPFWQGVRLSVQIIGLYCLVILFAARFSPSSPKSTVWRWMSHLSPPAHSRCPFCGMTRSFQAMSSGNWASARTYNEQGPVTYSIAVCLSLCAMALSCRNAYRWTHLFGLRALCQRRGKT